MEIIFDNHEKLTIDFVDSPVTDYFKKCFRHLQHVPFEFFERNLPYYNNPNSAGKLYNFAKKLNIDVDQEQLKDQQYLNQLHQIYEDNYVSGPEWLDFHDYIHQCEDMNNNSGHNNAYHIDWRESAGPLIAKFDYNWKTSFVHTIQEGELFTVWTELGKKPYVYWKDGEPNDLKRLCELAKPAISLEPKIKFVTKTKHTLPSTNAENFNNWWSNYHDDWCSHWQIPSWSYHDMYGAIVYGKIRELDTLQYLAEHNHCPVKIKI